MTKKRNSKTGSILNFEIKDKELSLYSPEQILRSMANQSHKNVLAQFRISGLMSVNNCDTLDQSVWFITPSEKKCKDKYKTCKLDIKSKPRNTPHKFKDKQLKGVLLSVSRGSPLDVEGRCVAMTTRKVYI